MLWPYAFTSLSDHQPLNSKSTSRVHLDLTILQHRLGRAALACRKMVAGPGGGRKQNPFQRSTWKWPVLRGSPGRARIFEDYHSVVKHGSLRNPRTKWRFECIIYKGGLSIAMFDCQRVSFPKPLWFISIVFLLKDLTGLCIEYTHFQRHPMFESSAYV